MVRRYFAVHIRLVIDVQQLARGFSHRLLLDCAALFLQHVEGLNQSHLFVVGVVYLTLGLAGV